MDKHNRIVYIIGNGYDIATGLPTKYEDYLDLVKNWKYFYDTYLQNINNGKEKINEHLNPKNKNYKEYADHTCVFRRNEISKMNQILTGGMFG